jgi:hypothetical protein
MSKQILILQVRTKRSRCELPDEAVVLRASPLINSKTGQLLDPPEYEVTFYIQVEKGS